MKYLPLLLALLPVNAGAGAWLQPEGKGEAIISSGYYSAHNNFDAGGNRQDMPLYSKYEIAPYAEYGLTEAITIGGGLALKQSSNAFGDKNKYGLDDLSVFIRSYLYEGSIAGDDSLVISAQPGLYLPFKLEGEINQQSGLSPSLKLNMGYGTRDYFAEFMLGYEYWKGSDSDRIVTQISVGYDLTDNFTYLAQLFTTNITSDNYSSNGNYDLAKIQSSLIWKYDESVYHQFGVTYDVSGKNTGAGYGFLYSVWYKF
jgi:protein XagA